MIFSQKVYYFLNFPSPVPALCEDLSGVSTAVSATGFALKLIVFYMLHFCALKLVTFYIWNLSHFALKLIPFYMLCFACMVWTLLISFDCQGVFPGLIFFPGITFCIETYHILHWNLSHFTCYMLCLYGMNSVDIIWLSRCVSRFDIFSRYHILHLKPITFCIETYPILHALLVWYELFYIIWLSRCVSRFDIFSRYHILHLKLVTFYMLCFAWLVWTVLYYLIVKVCFPVWPSLPLGGKLHWRKESSELCW